MCVCVGKEESWVWGTRGMSIILRRLLQIRCEKSDQEWWQWGKKAGMRSEGMVAARM